MHVASRFFGNRLDRYNSACDVYRDIIDKFYKYHDYTLIDKALSMDSVLLVFNKNDYYIECFRNNCIPNYNIDVRDFPGIMNDLNIINYQ